MGGSCVKCHETELATLCCHHLDPSTKSFKVFEKLDSNLDDMLDEAKKCILMCHNCHIEHHHNVAKPQKLKLLKYVGIYECQECGYSKNPSALHFHHISNKNFQISSYYFNNASEVPASIKQELNFCKILCSNCHAKSHFDYDFYSNNYSEILEKSNEYTGYNRYDKSKIIPLFLDGNSVEQIENITNIPRQLITAELTKSGIVDFGKKIDVTRIKDLHDRGLNSFEISKELNKSQSSICRCLQRLGLTPHKRKHGNSKITITLDELESRLKSKTLTEIASEFNVSRHAMYKKMLRLKSQKGEGCTPPP